MFLHKIIQTFFLIFTFSFISIFVCYTSVSAAPLTSVRNIPWNSVKSINGKHTIKFTTINSIPSNGKIVITFPIDFNVSGAVFDSWSNFDGGQIINVSGQVITITRNGLGTITTAGSKYIVLNNIINSTTVSSNYFVSVETRSSSDVTIDGSTNSSVFSIVPAVSGTNHSVWNQTGKNSQHSSLTSVPGPLYGTVKWVRGDSSSGSIRGEISLGEDGMIYSSTAWPMRISAINPDSTIKWTFNPALNGEVKTVIVDDTNTVYASPIEGYWGYLYAINSDGTIKWIYDFGGTRAGAYGPASYFNDGVDNVIVINMQSGGSYGIRAADGVLKWFYGGPGSYYNGTWTSTAVSIDNKIYTTYDTDNSLRSINTSGVLQWFKTFEDVHYNSPSIATNGTIYFPNKTGKLYSLNPTDGTTNWTYTTIGNSQLAVVPGIGSNGMIYFGDQNGILYKLKDQISSSSLQWTYATGDSFYNEWPGQTGFTIDSNQTVYAASNAHLFSVNKDGQFQWSYKANTNNPDVPIDNNGNIYLKTAASQVVVLQPWTLSTALNLINVNPGTIINITASSTMLSSDPLSSEDNKVQAVFDNGDKVALVYDSTDLNGNSIWKGNYTIPTNTIEGLHTYVVEASAYKVETNIPTNFAVFPTNSNNTGINTTGTYTVDTTNPTGSISINNEAIYTNTSSINLTLTGIDNLSGISSMMISEDSNFTSSVWETFSTTRSFTMSTGDGNKTIYMKLKDNAGNISSIYHDSIILDTLVPSTLVITKIGRISNIPNLDLLTYYYIGTSLDILGTGEPKATTYFTYNGKVNTAIVDDSGMFSLSIPLSSLEDHHSIEYYQKDLSGLSSTKRLLKLITDCEKNFSDTLKEKYCPSDIESSSSGSSSTTSSSPSQTSSSIVSSSSSSSISITEETITLMFVSGNKEPFINTTLIINGISYTTKLNGEVTIPKIKGKYSVQLISKTVEVFGEFTIGDSNKVITVELQENKSSKATLNLPLILVSIIVIISIVSLVYIIRRKQNSNS